MAGIDLTKALVLPSFWIGAKYSDCRCIQRLKPSASHLLLLIGWKKYHQIITKADLNSRLIDLPHDVMESILLRLPTKSIFCMQCASKAFSSAINNPLFASLHTSALLNNGAAEVPELLLFCRTKPSKGCFRMQLRPLKRKGESNFTKSNHTFLVSKIQSDSLISFFYIEFVFHNLLFFKSKSVSYLVNPLKGEVLKIPTTETNSKIDENWYGMGFDGTTNSFKIVHAYKDLEKNQLTAQVYVLRPRSCFWREIPAAPPCDLSSNNISAYGDMHWLVSEGSNRDIGGGRSHIISFDFKKEEFCWTPHPTLEELWNNIICLNDYFLINMKGSMTIVDISLTLYFDMGDERLWEERVVIGL